MRNLFSPGRLFFSGVLLFALAAPLCAEDTLFGPAIDYNGHAQSGTILLTREKITISGTGIPLADLTEIQHKTEIPTATPKAIFCLTTGEQIQAKEFDGDDKKIYLKTRYDLSIELPLEQLAGVVFLSEKKEGTPRRTPEEGKEAVLHRGAANDLLLWTDPAAPSERCTIKRIVKEEIVVEIDNKPASLKPMEICALTLNSTSNPPMLPQGLQLCVTMGGGDRLIGIPIEWDQEKGLTLERTDKSRLQLPTSFVGTLSVLGGRVMFLSDQAPLRRIEYGPTATTLKGKDAQGVTSSLTLTQDFEKGSVEIKNAEGKGVEAATFTELIQEDYLFSFQNDKGCYYKTPLLLNGKPVSKGIGAHSYSSLTYQIPEGIASFQATIGIDDSAKLLGCAVFRVLLDDKETFNSGSLAMTKEALRRALPQTKEEALPKEGTQEISIPVKPGAKLTLIVEYGPAATLFAGDRAVWGSARFVRDGKP